VNLVFDGGSEVLRDVAMATSFWLSLGYNFGCMIASDTLCDSMKCLRVVAMATNFGTKIAVTGFVWTIATRRLVIGGWSELSADRMKILPIPCT